MDSQLIEFTTKVHDLFKLQVSYLCVFLQAMLCTTFFVPSPEQANFVYNQAIYYPARACATRGKVIEFVCCLSVGQKILRWRELATSRTSEHIRSFENNPIILTCTCYWADSLPLAGISAVFLLSGPPVSHFIYG